MCVVCVVEGGVGGSVPIQSDVMGSKVTVHSCKNHDGQLAERETQLWHIVAAGSVRSARERALAIPARP